VSVWPNGGCSPKDLHTQNLTLQLDRLETDLGAQLVHRAPHRYEPMVPAADGKRLLKQLSKPDVRELLDRYADAFTRPKCGPYKQNRSRQ
jgi:DNA-binding transcriptional LysR family regulator